MKFILFCEGYTERSALPQFLNHYLNSQGLSQKVGVQPVRFNGWAEMVKDSRTKAHLHLRNPDVVAVIALLDLYGPTIYPANCIGAMQRVAWAKQHLETAVGHPKFRQHFAVHDVEAWILSQPDILPVAVKKKLPGKVAQPETINFNEPPAYLLDRLYSETMKRGYKKVTYGDQLFRELNPTLVAQRCPSFRAMTEDMLALAKAALDG